MLTEDETNRRALKQLAELAGLGCLDQGLASAIWNSL